MPAKKKGNKSKGGKSAKRQPQKSGRWNRFQSTPNAITGSRPKQGEPAAAAAEGPQEDRVQAGPPGTEGEGEFLVVGEGQPQEQQDSTLSGEGGKGDDPALLEKRDCSVGQPASGGFGPSGGEDEEGRNTEEEEGSEEEGQQPKKGTPSKSSLPVDYLPIGGRGKSAHMAAKKKGNTPEASAQQQPQKPGMLNRLKSVWNSITGRQPQEQQDSVLGGEGGKGDDPLLGKRDYSGGQPASGSFVPSGGEKEEGRNEEAKEEERQQPKKGSKSKLSVTFGFSSKVTALDRALDAAEEKGFDQERCEKVMGEVFKAKEFADVQKACARIAKVIATKELPADSPERLRGAAVLAIASCDRNEKNSYPVDRMGELLRCVKAVGLKRAFGALNGILCARGQWVNPWPLAVFAANAFKPEEPAISRLLVCLALTLPLDAETSTQRYNWSADHRSQKEGNIALRRFLKLYKNKRFVGAVGGCTADVFTASFPRLLAQLFDVEEYIETKEHFHCVLTLFECLRPCGFDATDLWLDIMRRYHPASQYRNGLGDGFTAWTEFARTPQDVLGCRIATVAGEYLLKFPNAFQNDDVLLFHQMLVTGDDWVLVPKIADYLLSQSQVDIRWLVGTVFWWLGRYCFERRVDRVQQFGTVMDKLFEKAPALFESCTNIRWAQDIPDSNTLGTICQCKWPQFLVATKQRSVLVQLLCQFLVFEVGNIRRLEIDKWKEALKRVATVPWDLQLEAVELASFTPWLVPAFPSSHPADFWTKVPMDWGSVCHSATGEPSIAFQLWNHTLECMLKSWSHQDGDVSGAVRKMVQGLDRYPPPKASKTPSLRIALDMLLVMLVDMRKFEFVFKDGSILKFDQSLVKLEPQQQNFVERHLRIASKTKKLVEQVERSLPQERIASTAHCTMSEQARYAKVLSRLPGGESAEQLYTTWAAHISTMEKDFGQLKHLTKELQWVLAQLEEAEKRLKQQGRAPGGGGAVQEKRAVDQLVSALDNMIVKGLSSAQLDNLSLLIQKGERMVKMAFGSHEKQYNDTVVFPTPPSSLVNNFVVHYLLTEGTVRDALRKAMEKVVPFLEGKVLGDDIAYLLTDIRNVDNEVKLLQPLVKKAIGQSIGTALKRRNLISRAPMLNAFFRSIALSDAGDVKEEVEGNTGNMQVLLSLADEELRVIEALHSATALHSLAKWIASQHGGNGPSTPGAVPQWEATFRTRRVKEPLSANNVLASSSDPSFAIMSQFSTFFPVVLALAPRAPPLTVAQFLIELRLRIEQIPSAAREKAVQSLRELGNEEEQIRDFIVAGQLSSQSAKIKSEAGERVESHSMYRLHVTPYSVTHAIVSSDGKRTYHEGDALEDFVQQVTLAFTTGERSAKEGQTPGAAVIRASEYAKRVAPVAQDLSQRGHPEFFPFHQSWALSKFVAADPFEEDIEQLRAQKAAWDTKVRAACTTTPVLLMVPIRETLGVGAGSQAAAQRVSALLAQTGKQPPRIPVPQKTTDLQSIGRHIAKQFNAKPLLDAPPFRETSLLLAEYEHFPDVLWTCLRRYERDGQPLPMPFQLMWCTARTTAADVDFFFRAVEVFPKLRFTVLGAEFLPHPAMRCLLSHLQAFGDERKCAHVLVCAKSPAYELRPLLTSVGAEQQEIRNIVPRSNGILFVIGHGASGKSTFIRRSVKGPLGLLSIHASTHCDILEQAVDVLRSEGLAQSSDVWVNVSKYAFDTADGVYGVCCLLFQLLLYRVLRQSGEAVALKSTKIWIEVSPSSTAPNEDPLDNLKHVLGPLSRCGHVTTQSTNLAKGLDVDDVAQYICFVERELMDTPQLKAICDRMVEQRRTDGIASAISPQDPSTVRQFFADKFGAERVNYVQFKSWEVLLFHMLRFVEGPQFAQWVSLGVCPTHPNGPCQCKGRTPFAPKITGTLFPAVQAQARWFSTPMTKLNLSDEMRQMLLTDASGEFLPYPQSPPGSEKTELEKLAEATSQFTHKYSVLEGEANRAIGKVKVTREHSVVASIFGSVEPTPSTLIEIQRVQEEMSFVILPDIIARMVLIRNRMDAGVSLIFVSVTGVGKSYMIRFVQKVSAFLPFHQLDAKYKQAFEKALGAPSIEAFTEATSKLSIADRIKKCQDLLDAGLQGFPLFDFDEATKVLDEIKQQHDLSSELLSTFAERVQGAKKKACFFKVMVHPGLTAEHLVSKMKEVVQRAKDLASDDDTKALKVAVFFDELNTSSIPGLFKLLIADRRLPSMEEPLPDNIFFVAAINPTVDETGARYAVEELHPTLKCMAVELTPMDNDARMSYVHQVLLMKVKSAWGEFDAPFNRELGDMIHYAYTISEVFGRTLRKEDEKWLFGKRRGLNTIGGPVSQRDIQRVFVLSNHIYDLLKKVRAIEQQQQQLDDGKNIPAEMTPEAVDKKKEEKEDVVLSFVASVFFAFIARLEHGVTYTGSSARQWITSSIPHWCSDLFARAGIGFPNDRNIFASLTAKVVSRIVNKNTFRIPPGIALTSSLRENIFLVLLCVLCKGCLPVAIIGLSGRGKTLSVSIVQDNMNRRNPTPLFAKLPALKISYLQGSVSTTAAEISKMFSEVEKRQQAAQDNTLFLICFDEAGLPEDEMKVMKAVHEPIDRDQVPFVCLSNRPFDAANQNRMLTAWREVETKDDIVMLAAGCLGYDIADLQADPVLKNAVTGLADAFVTLSEKKGFARYQSREFIYLCRHLNAYRGKRLTPEALLEGLEYNYGGNEDFEAVVEVFFDCMARATNQKGYFNTAEIQRRPVAQQIQDALSRPRPEGQHLRPRFSLLIDPTDDFSCSRDLIQCIPSWPRPNAPNRKVEEVYVSNFPADATPSHDAKIVASLRYHMEVGTTVVLYNPDRILGSLFDVLNRNTSEASVPDPDHPGHFVVKYFSRLAIGAETHPCEVHDDFHIIFVLRKAFVSRLEQTTMPFLSRLEKYLLPAERYAGPNSDRSVRAVVDFIEKVVGREAIPGAVLPYTAHAALLHPDTAAMERVAPEFGSDRALVFGANARALQAAMPERVLLAGPKLAEWERYASEYFSHQAHFSLEHALQQRNGDLTPLMVSTRDVVGMAQLAHDGRCVEADSFDTFDEFHSHLVATAASPPVNDSVAAAIVTISRQTADIDFISHVARDILSLRPKYEAVAFVLVVAVPHSVPCTFTSGFFSLYLDTLASKQGLAPSLVAAAIGVDATMNDKASLEEQLVWNAVRDVLHTESKLFTKPIDQLPPGSTSALIYDRKTPLKEKRKKMEEVLKERPELFRIVATSVTLCLQREALAQIVKETAESCIGGTLKGPFSDCLSQRAHNRFAAAAKEAVIAVAGDYGMVSIIARPDLSEFHAALVKQFLANRTSPFHFAAPPRCAANPRLAALLEQAISSSLTSCEDIPSVQREVLRLVGLLEKTPVGQLVSEHISTWAVGNPLLEDYIYDAVASKAPGGEALIEPMTEVLRSVGLVNSPIASLALVHIVDRIPFLWDELLGHTFLGSMASLVGGGEAATEEWNDPEACIVQFLKMLCAFVEKFRYASTSIEAERCVTPLLRVHAIVSAWMLQGSHAEKVSKKMLPIHAALTVLQLSVAGAPCRYPWLDALRYLQDFKPSGIESMSFHRMFRAAARELPKTLRSETWETEVMLHALATASTEEAAKDVRELQHSEELRLRQPPNLTAALLEKAFPSAGDPNVGHRVLHAISSLLGNGGAEALDGDFSEPHCGRCLRHDVEACFRYATRQFEQFITQQSPPMGVANICEAHEHLAASWAGHEGTAAYSVSACALRHCMIEELAKHTSKLPSFGPDLARKKGPVAARLLPTPAWEQAFVANCLNGLSDAEVTAALESIGQHLPNFRRFALGKDEAWCGGTLRKASVLPFLPEFMVDGNAPMHECYKLVRDAIAAQSPTVVDCLPPSADDGARVLFYTLLFDEFGRGEAVSNVAERLKEANPYKWNANGPHFRLLEYFADPQSACNALAGKLQLPVGGALYAFPATPSLLSTIIEVTARFPPDSTPTTHWEMLLTDPSSLLRHCAFGDFYKSEGLLHGFDCGSPLHNGLRRENIPMPIEHQLTVLMMTYSCLLANALLYPAKVGTWYETVVTDTFLGNKFGDGFDKLNRSGKLFVAVKCAHVDYERNTQARLPNMASEAKFSVFQRTLARKMACTQSAKPFYSSMAEREAAEREFSQCVVAACTESDAVCEHLSQLRGQSSELTAARQLAAKIRLVPCPSNDTNIAEVAAKLPHALSLCAQIPRLIAFYQALHSAFSQDEIAEEEFNEVALRDIGHDDRMILSAVPAGVEAFNSVLRINEGKLQNDCKANDVQPISMETPLCQLFVPVEGEQGDHQCLLLLAIDTAVRSAKAVAALANDLPAWKALVDLGVVEYPAPIAHALKWALPLASGILRDDFGESLPLCLEACRADPADRDASPALVRHLLQRYVIPLSQVQVDVERDIKMSFHFKVVEPPSGELGRADLWAAFPQPDEAAQKGVIIPNEFFNRCKILLPAQLDQVLDILRRVAEALLVRLPDSPLKNPSAAPGGALVPEADDALPVAASNFCGPADAADPSWAAIFLLGGLEARYVSVVFAAVSSAANSVRTDYFFNEARCKLHPKIPCCHAGEAHARELESRLEAFCEGKAPKELLDAIRDALDVIFVLAENYPPETALIAAYREYIADPRGTEDHPLNAFPHEIKVGHVAEAYGKLRELQCRVTLRWCRETQGHGARYHEWPWQPSDPGDPLEGEEDQPKAKGRGAQDGEADAPIQDDPFASTGMLYDQPAKPDKEEHTDNDGLEVEETWEEEDTVSNMVNEDQLRAQQQAYEATVPTVETFAEPLPQPRWSKLRGGRYHYDSPYFTIGHAEWKELRPPMLLEAKNVKAQLAALPSMSKGRCSMCDATGQEMVLNGFENTREPLNLTQLIKYNTEGHAPAGVACVSFNGVELSAQNLSKVNHVVFVVKKEAALKKLDVGKGITVTALSSAYVHGVAADVAKIAGGRCLLLPVDPSGSVYPLDVTWGNCGAGTIQLQKEKKGMYVVRCGADIAGCFASKAPVKESLIRLCRGSLLRGPRLGDLEAANGWAGNQTTFADLPSLPLNVGIAKPRFVERGGIERRVLSVNVRRGAHRPQVERLLFPVKEGTSTVSVQDILSALRLEGCRRAQDILSALRLEGCRRAPIVVDARFNSVYPSDCEDVLTANGKGLPSLVVLCGKDVPCCKVEVATKGPVRRCSAVFTAEASVSNVLAWVKAASWLADNMNEGTALLWHGVALTHSPRATRCRLGTLLSSEQEKLLSHVEVKDQHGAPTMEGLFESDDEADGSSEYRGAKHGTDRAETPPHTGMEGLFESDDEAGGSKPLAEDREAKDEAHADRSQPKPEGSEVKGAEAPLRTVEAVEQLPFLSFESVSGSALTLFAPEKLAWLSFPCDVMDPQLVLDRPPSEAVEGGSGETAAEEGKEGEVRFACHCMTDVLERQSLLTDLLHIMLPMTKEVAATIAKVVQLQTVSNADLRDIRQGAHIVVVEAVDYHHRARLLMGNDEDMNSVVEAAKVQLGLCCGADFECERIEREVDNAEVTTYLLREKSFKNEK